MSKYLLKITGSNDIVNIVEWNETGSLEAPSGYVFEPFVTGSTDFINYITDTTQSNLPSFYGEMAGYFTGELTGSIKYNGKTFEEFINETEYGSIGIISGSDINILNRPGYVSLISENNIILPISLTDSGSSYNRALNRITDENISNYLLKFKLDQNTELQYLINQTVLTSSGELNYYNLDGVLQSTSSLNGNTFEEYFNISNTHGSPWHIDFDLGDKTHIGKFYGDFIGNVDITSASMDALTVSGTINLSGSMGVTGPIFTDDNDSVLSTRQGCDAVLKLRNVFTDIGIDPAPKWSMTEGYPLYVGSVNSIYTRFDVHIPQDSWFDKFYITLPLYATNPTSDFDKESWWYTLIRKLLGGNSLVDTHPGRKGITLKFNGLLDATGKNLATKEYMYVEFTNDKAISHTNNGIKAFSFPVKLIGNRNSFQNSDSGISDKIREWENYPNTDNVNVNQPDISGISFCLQFNNLETCAECQESTNTNTNTISTTNNDDTSLAMSWHTNVVNYDQNGTPLSQLQEMEVGTIAISDSSRGIQDKYMGNYSEWPAVNFKSVKHLAIALSDGDVNNLLWSDWQGDNVYDVEDYKYKYNNIYNAINGDMSLLYRLLNQVKIMQGLKPTFYGRYNDSLSYTNEQYTSLMTIRCLDNSHPGSIEMFDITGVEFIGSGIDTNLRWSNVVAAGGFTSLALKARTRYENSIWMWGKNNVYQLGINNIDEQNTPYRVSNDSWISASINVSHSMAINKKGEVWVWGDNQYGQLGQGNYTNSTTPVMVSGDIGDYTRFIGQKLHKVSTGNNHSCIIERRFAESSSERRNAYFCGNNEYGQLGISINTSYVSLSDNITNTRLSRLSIPQFYTDEHPDSSSTALFFNYNNFVDVSCGHDYTLAIITNRDNIDHAYDFTKGALYAAGRNDTYQLGLGNTINKDEFTPLNVGNDWVYINAGYSHNFAIKDNGTLWSWGKNTYGQLGLGNTTDATTPTQVGSDTNWKKVVACGFGNAGFSLGLKTNGELWVWGYNAYGQLGLNNTTPINTPTRLGSSYWVDIDGGYEHSIGVKNDGPTGGLVGGNAIYSWGYNPNGQLGIGSKTANQQKLVPTKIDNGTSKSAVTHAILDVNWIGGSNKQHSDGINTDKHKLKVSIQPMHTPYPSYYEIFTIYDIDNNGTYKKWKYKGWEKNLKVICIGGGGGGGSAPREEFGYITTAAGGGGGGAVAMAEFLAAPFRVTGYTDNYPLFYGIPKEVDIHVGPGGYSAKTIPVTPRIIELQTIIKDLIQPIEIEIATLRSQLRTLISTQIQYVKVKNTYGKGPGKDGILGTDDDIDIIISSELVLLPGSNFNTVQELTDAINDKKDEIQAKEYEITTSIAPYVNEIKNILIQESLVGFNGINGSFSRFGDYLIAAGGDGGKAGKRIANNFFSQHLSLSKNLEKTIAELLVTDGGKGGGKEILLKPTDDKRGVYKLYPFKSNNTPNVGLSSTYLPGGNGGMGSLGNSQFTIQANTNRITDLQNNLIPNAGTNLFSAYSNLLAAQNAFAQYTGGDLQTIETLRAAVQFAQTEYNNTLDIYNNLLSEKLGLEKIQSAYSYVINNPNIYTNDAESVFYACTGGGGGFGLGGSIYGTKYSHEFGNDYKNVAAIIPQSVKLADYKSNQHGAGFKLGLGGDGGTLDKINVENIYNSGNLNSVPKKNGGFPGGGGGGGIPSTNDTFNEIALNNRTGEASFGAGIWDNNDRGGGNGGDGLVIVIGM